MKISFSFSQSDRIKRLHCNKIYLSLSSGLSSLSRENVYLNVSALAVNYVNVSTAGSSAGTTSPAPGWRKLKKIFTWKSTLTNWVHFNFRKNSSGSFDSDFFKHKLTHKRSSRIRCVLLISSTKTTYLAVFFASSEESSFSKYSQTWPNGHLWIATTSVQQPQFYWTNFYFCKVT